MKKMSKKTVFTVIGILTLMVGILALSFACGKCTEVQAEETTAGTEDSEVTVLYSGTSGDLDWSITSDGVLTVEGSGDYAQDHTGIKISGVGDFSFPEWICYRDEIKSAVVNVSNITNMQCMFLHCSNLTTVDFGETDTSKVTDMKYMFLWCSSLASVDLAGFDTSNVLDMSYMFWWCDSLTTLDLSSFDTSKVIYMISMFYSCDVLWQLDEHFDTSSVVNMYGLFSWCSKLESLDLSGFDTSNVKNMAGLFYHCSALTELDVSGFDTANNIDMSYMFYGCSKVSELDVSGFDTSGVTNMSYMFYGCSGVSELDVSGFDTSNVTDISYMFYKCSKITHLDISAFDTSKVTTFLYTFSGCGCLTELDVSGFDTTNVTSMYGMFSNCESLTSLDLSVFDFSALESSKSVENMLKNCANLETITVSSGVPYEITLPVMDGYQWCDASGNIVTEIEKESGEAITYTRYKIAVTTDFGEDGLVTLPANSYTYTGSEIRPTVTVTYNSTTLTEGTDYTVAYTNNIEVGTATVTVTGAGEYAGTLTATFEIKKASQTVTVSAGSTTLYVGGSTAKVTASANGGGTISFSSSKTTVAKVGSSTGVVTAVAPGTATITVRAASTANYNSATKTVTVKVSLTSCSVSYVVNTMDGLKVTWGKVEGASGYYIYRKTSGGGYPSTPTKVVTGGSTTSWTDPAVLTGGKDYTYKVAAYYRDSSGKETVYASGTTKTCKYLKGGEVTEVSNTASGVKVTWKKVEGANGYQIFRKVSGDEYEQVKEVSGGSTLNWTDTASLTSGEDYTYKVSPIFTNSQGNITKGGAKTTKTIKYLAPGEVTELTNTASGITVKWKKVTGATGYRIYRKTGSGSYSQVKTVTGASTTSWSDTSFDTSNTSGTNYSYKVEPYFKSSKGVTTLAGVKTTKTIKYLSPCEIGTLANAADGITVQWKKVTGASGYYIYRKSGSGSYSQVKTVTSGSTLSYTDTSVKNNNVTPYTYYVKPYYKNSSGTITTGEYKAAKTTVRLCSISISSLTNVATKKMTISWAKVSGVTGYQIRYSTSPSFGNDAKTVTITGASETSKTITSLIKNKTYYVSIRTYYQTSSGGPYYSAWSSAKSVKITK